MVVYFQITLHYIMIIVYFQTTLDYDDGLVFSNNIILLWYDV